MSKLDHPNIVKIYNIFEDEVFYYIIMEYVNGVHIGEIVE